MATTETIERRVLCGQIWRILDDASIERLMAVPVRGRNTQLYENARALPRLEYAWAYFFDQYGRRWKWWCAHCSSGVVGASLTRALDDHNTSVDRMWAYTHPVEINFLPSPRSSDRPELPPAEEPHDAIDAMGRCINQNWDDEQEAHFYGRT